MTVIRSEKAAAVINGKYQDFDVTLEWSVDSPLEVWFTFHCGDRDIEWVFARDLLATAVRNPAFCAGKGDVRFSPGTHPGAIWMTVDNTTLERTFAFSATKLFLFLSETEQYIKVGDENTTITDDDIWEWLSHAES